MSDERAPLSDEDAPREPLADPGSKTQPAEGGRDEATVDGDPDAEAPERGPSA